MVHNAVVCHACNRSNPADMRFCGYCGSALPLHCTVCGRSVPPGMSFCGYCGTALSSPVARGEEHDHSGPEEVSHASVSEAAAAGAPQEERRLVTALFCDLVGFTPLAEQLDPEEIRDLQAAYFSAMAAQIERYGGSVEKYAGDAVLALFGAPVAHEDDAERAVLCALDMQAAIDPVAERARERWQTEPRIRIGVNTGEVVSGIWNASGRQDVAVSGDAVNTAARIQAATEPGEILVGAETMRLTRRRIRYAERRELVLKGKSIPVPVWPARGIREEFGERWEGYQTPLVGRDRELVQLLDAWVRAQGGEGQLVTVVGDAGVGKSRLIAEFLSRMAASAAVRVVRARSLSYGQEISLWLLADLLRSLFGVKEQDTPDEVGNKLERSIQNLLPDPEGRVEATDVLGEVLGLAIGESPVARAGPQARRHALVRSVRSVLAAAARNGPMILVLEDLHWTDNASRDVLAQALADVLGTRMLVLVGHRPGWTAPWSEWGWPERLTLRPLGEHEASALAGAVLGGSQLSPDLERHVAERAGGNPFFVEEMLRGLQETGGLVERDGRMTLRPGAAERLPSTLTEVLLARLDRLESEPRQVAQVASVIGRSFGVRLLAGVVGQEPATLETPLAQLQRAEIAFPRRNPDLEYVFKHVSMRDVAYNTLVQRRRQELHLQTARTIASLYPSEEYVEMIAYHYAQTDTSEAAEWLERAGDRAAAVYANEEAIGHFRQALRRREQETAGGDVLGRLEEKLGSVLYTVGRYDDAVAHLQKAAELARAERDLESAGRRTALVGMAHRARGTPEEGIALVSPMIDLLSWAEPSTALASLYLAQANLAFLVGRYRDQLAAAVRAAEIATAIGSDALRGEAMERRGAAHLLLGHAEEGHRDIEGAIPVIEAGGDLMTLSRALINAGEAAKVRADVASTREWTERAIEIGLRIGNPAWVVFGFGNLADACRILGEWPEAHKALERASSFVAETAPLSASNIFLSTGRLALCEGEWEGAERAFEEALAIAAAANDRQLTEAAHSYLAELDILRGSPDVALRRLRPLQATDEASLGVMLPTLAWAELEAGDIGGAEETARRAVKRTRGAEPIYLIDALRIQGAVFNRQGRHSDAERVLQEGLAMARSVPFPYAEARMLEELGDRKGAHAIFRRLGARKDAERTAPVATERQ